MIDVAAAALALVVNAHCGLGDTLEKLAAGIVVREDAALDVGAVTHNANGTDDHGLTQVNTVNYGWLSLAMNRPINDRTIMDVCTNLEAGLRVQFVRYNGNPPATIAAAYSTRAMDSSKAVDNAAQRPEPNYTVSLRPARFETPIRSPPAAPQTPQNTAVFMHPKPGRSLVFTPNRER